MEIANIQIIKVIQLIILISIAAFSLLSIILKDCRKKFIFIFMLFLFFGIFNLMLYYGLIFFILAIPIIIFLALFYLFNIQNEACRSMDLYLNYYNDNPERKSAPETTTGYRLRKADIPNLVFTLTLCAGIFTAFLYNKEQIFKETIEKEIRIISLSNVSKEIFQNYSLIILLIALLIFILIIWVISIAKLKRKQ